MTKTTLKFDSEVYGRFARASAVADYFEFSLWVAGKLAPVRVAKLQDMLADASIEVPESPYSDPSGADGGADSVSRVLDTMRERNRILGNKYPFQVADDQIKISRLQASHDPYLALLALTLAHAHDLSTTDKPERIFENIVTRVWKERGWLSYAFGTSRNFQLALQRAAKELHLQATLDNVVISRHSNDENVDTLSHYSWDDDRPGVQVVLSQATVGRSETWLDKFKEPSPRTWGLLLPDVNTPRVCLAVPHHVEPQHFRSLVQDVDGLVIDRLRIANFLPDTSAAERRLIKTVCACRPES